MNHNRGGGYIIYILYYKLKALILSVIYIS